MNKDVWEVEQQIRALRNQAAKVKMKMRKLSLPKARKCKNELKDLRRQIKVLRKKQGEVIRKNSKEFDKEFQKILNKKSKSNNRASDLYSKRVIKL